MALDLKKDEGFTIVEVLVVVAIITFFSIIIVADFPQVKMQLSLSRVTYQFQQHARRAQLRALSQTTFTDANNQTHQIAGFGLYVNLLENEKQYIMYADKFPGNQVYDNEDYTVEIIDISANEPGIIIKEIQGVMSDSVSINFTPPNPDTAITQLQEGQSAAEVVFAQEIDPTKTKSVSINTAGLIEVK